MAQAEVGLQHSVSHLGTAAVIDGRQLQITPLRHCVVPPPLCAVTASFPLPVQCVAFLNHQEAEVPGSPCPCSLCMLLSLQSSHPSDKCECFYS